MNIDEFIEELKTLMTSDNFIAMTLSNPVKTNKEFKKVSLSPVQLKSGYHIQFGFDAGRQMTHQNLEYEPGLQKLAQLLPLFKQVNGRFLALELQAHLSGAGKVSKIVKPLSTQAAPNQAVVAEHNRRKHYLLPDGQALDFLIALGLMSPEGHVFKASYDKFKQINRFIELVDHVVEDLPKDKTLRIIDFACGKAYLTFALYHYLVRIKALKVEIMGLDLKEQLIQSSNDLAKQFGMTGLHFETGDIAAYKDAKEVDMVVSLHACDTASDLALAFAVQHRAHIILSAPCCQHELFSQIQAPSLKLLLKQGLIKERFAALATDALRCSLLEQAGYKVDTLEFVDPEHTPKNLLIRASLKVSAANSKAKVGPLLTSQEYESLRDSLGAKPMLEELLKQPLE